MRVLSGKVTIRGPSSFPLFVFRDGLDRLGLLERDIAHHLWGLDPFSRGAAVKKQRRTPSFRDFAWYDVRRRGGAVDGF